MWHIIIYRDAAQEWRWRVLAGNGRVVSDGSEGYKTHLNCRRAVERYRKNLAIPDSIKTRDNAWIKMQPTGALTAGA